MAYLSSSTTKHQSSSLENAIACSPRRLKYIGPIQISYSALTTFCRRQGIGHRVEVRETKDRIEIHDGRRKSVSHERVIDPVAQRMTIPEHRPPRGQGVKRSDPPPEHKAIVQTVPELLDYVIALKKRGRKGWVILG